MRVGFTLLFSVFAAVAQAQTPKYDLYTNNVSVHLTQLIFPEVQVSYDRALNEKMSVEAALGIKIPKDDSKEFIASMFGAEVPYAYEPERLIPFMPFSNSQYAAVAFKLYQNAYITTSKFYWSFQLFYRNSSYCDKCIRVLIGEDDESYAVQQSQTQRIPGLKVLYGLRMPLIKFSDRTRIEADFFTGLSVRYKIIRTERYGVNIYSRECSEIDYYPETEILHERQVLPSVHLGVKLGVAWR